MDNNVAKPPVSLTEKAFHLVEFLHNPRNIQSNRILKWISQNPTVLKTAEKGGIIGGGLLVLSTPFTMATLGVTIGLGLSALGFISAAVSLIAYYTLDLIITPSHNMVNRTFTPQKWGAGELYYQGNVPVLELDYTKPFEAGRAHGYIMGEPLHLLMVRFKLMQQNRLFNTPDQFPHVLEEIRRQIPHEYLDEMQGIIQGLEEWSRVNPRLFNPKITLNDLILFHLMPDSIHFDPSQVEHNQFDHNQNLQQFQLPQRDPVEVAPVGCTVVVDKDEQKGFSFGHTVDWESYGWFGINSIITNRKHKNKKNSTVEVGFPGLVGTLTGMSKPGLCVTMNVCDGDTQKVNGMPAVFFNRMCIENCNTVEEVAQKIAEKPPLGSYHLSAVDKTSAKTFHLYQGDKGHVVREWHPHTPLVTTNCRYASDGNRTGNMFRSSERHEKINHIFSHPNDYCTGQVNTPAQLVSFSLTQHPINNELTVHKILMFPATNEMEVAFDNYRAGSRPLEKVNTQPLFA